jgi:hypothetical protein
MAMMSTIPTSQTKYPSLNPVYESPQSSTTTSAPVSSGYNYGYLIPGVTALLSPPSASDQYNSSSSTSTVVPIAHLEINTPNQPAIIAISVICGLLLMALIFAILVIIGKRYEWQQIQVGIEGGGGAHHRRRRRHRSEKTETEYGRWSLDDIGRPRVPSMNPAFFRPGPQPNINGNFGIAPHYFPDSRAPYTGAGQAGHGDREDIEEVEGVEELFEAGTTRAGGTRTMRSESDNGNRSSKMPSSHTRGRHRE